MKIRTIFTFVIIGMFAACTSPEKESPKNQEKNAISQNENASPENTVLNFLNWYKQNSQNLSFNLVFNNGDHKGGPTKFYSVDFPATEIYLTQLLESGFLSSKYAESQRAYFRKCDQKFKELPTDEGPPEGFDQDLVMFAQEDPGLNDLRKAQIKITKSDKASAVIALSFPESNYHYIYEMSKIGPKWLIDDIEPRKM